MAYSSWAEYEDRSVRSIVTTRGTMRFQTRTYAIGAGVAEADMPAKGTLMHDEADAIASWRTYEIPTGPLSATAARTLRITYYQLQGTTETVNGKTLLRLDGYPIRMDTADKTFYTLVYAAISESHLPDYGDAYSGDSFALAHSPTTAPDVWPGLFGATVRYAKSRLRTGSGPLILSRSVGSRQVGEFHYIAQVSVEVLDSQLDAYQATAWWAPHPTLQAGPYTPVATVVETQQGYDPDLPGMGKATLFYKTLREPGNAEVEITSTLDHVTVKKDAEGLPLVGPINDRTNAIGEYYIAKGSNQRVKPRSMFVWKAAFDQSSQLGMLKGLMGKINKFSMPNFPEAPEKETLMLVRKQIAHVWTGQDLWYVNLYFLEEPEGWNDVTKRAKRVTLPVELPRFTPSGIPGQYVEVAIADKVVVQKEEGGYLSNLDGVFFHIGDNAVDDTVLFEAVSFSSLNALLLKW